MGTICKLYEKALQTNRKNESIQRFWYESGDPYGTRTRVYAVKGRRPRPLDEGVTE
jgi:hypothetical protein